MGGIREKDMEMEILEKGKANPKEDAISMVGHTMLQIAKNNVEYMNQAQQEAMHARGARRSKVYCKEVGCVRFAQVDPPQPCLAYAWFAQVTAAHV